VSEPEGTTELVVDGRPVLRYLRGDGDRPQADLARVLVTVEHAVPLVLRELAGWYLSTDDPDFERALVARGATLARHAHVYGFDLAAAGGGIDPAWGDPSLPRGLRVAGVTRPASELAAVELVAFPPGHPDHEFTDAAQARELMQRLVDGEVVGPLFPDASSVVVDDDRVVAFLLVNRMPGAPPFGGPWLSDVARDPDPTYRGLGTVLVRRALAVLAAADETTLGLVVSEGNPARGLYESIGFGHRHTSRRLLLPSGPGGT
jgi:ribosomal protein S18 acetylase RimI-like enzyme